MHNIDDLKRDIIFRANLREHDLVIHSTWGLFSPRDIDEGTSLLIKNLQLNPDDTNLDLGCGYGPIGLTMAKLSPSGITHLVDKDFVAVQYAKKNAAINKIRNVDIYLSNGFSSVPGIKFDNIVSNLPAKVGKELYTILFYDVREHLKDNGSFYIVTLSGLKEYIKRTFYEIFGSYEKIDQSKNYLVARAFKS